MKYEDLKNQKIKDMVDTLDHKTYTMEMDIRDALEESDSEKDFLELVIKRIRGIMSEGEEIKKKIEEIQETEHKKAYDKWMGDLSDKEMLEIFFNALDPISIQEYLEQEYKEQLKKS